MKTIQIKPIFAIIGSLVFSFGLWMLAHWLGVAVLGILIIVFSLINPVKPPETKVK